MTAVTTPASPSHGRPRDPAITQQAHDFLVMVDTSPGQYTTADVCAALNIGPNRWASVRDRAKELAVTDYGHALIRPIPATGFTWKMSTTWVSPTDYEAADSEIVAYKVLRRLLERSVTVLDMCITAMPRKTKKRQRLESMRTQLDGFQAAIDMRIDDVAVELAAIAAGNSTGP